MFPEDFWWGVSSSGFQFEMGDIEKKYIDPNTDWFKWVHDEYNIKNGFVSGDLPEDGIDYFTRYKLDHDLAVDIGLNTWRMGVEWSRIFPISTSNVDVDVYHDSYGNIIKVDVDDKDIEKLDNIADIKAVEHYKRIINDLKQKGFQVILCLNHFTLPLWIHDPIMARDSGLRRGPLGWIDKNIVVEFSKYAAYMAYKFGGLIDYWATLNEPLIVAEAGYLKMETFPPYYRKMGFPPRLSKSAFAKAIINMVYAHVNAYNNIKKWDREIGDNANKHPANIGLIHNVMPIQPYRPDKEIDIETARFLSFIHNEFILEAIVNGWLDRNLDMKKDKNEIVPTIKNHLDWLGINYYCRIVVRGRLGFLARIVMGTPAFFDTIPGYGFTAGEANIERSYDGYPVTDIGWEVYPKGLKEALHVVSKYNRPILVTENGLADRGDRYRSQFIVSHLKVLEDAIDEMKIDVFGYLHWALTDNYEWSHGFKMRFGLYHVDLNTKERKPRPSVKVFKRIVQENTVSKDLYLAYRLQG